MKDYNKLALEIINQIGGRENIQDVFHCATRLRFTLKSSEKANTESIKKINGVLSVVESGGMYMVVIGPDVSKVYNEIESILEMNNRGKNETSEVEESDNRTLFQKLLAYMIGSFKPILGLMAASGLLKGFKSLIILIAPGFSDSTTYTALYGISDAILYFMPIFIAGSAAKYLKMDLFLGVLIGSSLIYPSIIEVSMQEATFTLFGLDMVVDKLFGIIPWVAVNYTNSLLPPLVAIFIAAPIYKKCQEKIPDLFQTFLTPLITLVIAVMATLIIFGPVMSVLSAFIGWVLGLIFEFSPWLAGLLIGGPWILMVMSGLHLGFTPVFINEIALTGSSAILGFLGANQMAMAGALFAILFKTKKDKVKGLASANGITALLGISEPGLYGVLIPSKVGLVWSVIGGSLGGMVAAIMGARLYSTGLSGIMQIALAISAENPMGTVGYILSLIIGFAVGFVGTYFMYTPKYDKVFE